MGETVTLSAPVRVGDQDVTEIALREPTAGELRGLKLTDLLQGDAAALIRLLPRISEPHLTEAQVAALSPRDLVALFGGVAGFFADGDETAGS